MCLTKKHFSVRDRGQSALFREVKPQREVYGPLRNPPRSLAGGCSNAFAQLGYFPRYPAAWRAVGPHFPDTAT